MLLTEKHTNDTLFPSLRRKEIEIAEKNKMVCIIETAFSNRRFLQNALQVGYVVLHHSEILPIIFKDSSRDYLCFKKIISDILGDEGDLYSMTPKEEKEYYVIGIKIATERKRKDVNECIKSLILLENIFTKTYDKQKGTFNRKIAN